MRNFADQFVHMRMRVRSGMSKAKLSIFIFCVLLFAAKLPCAAVVSVQDTLAKRNAGVSIRTNLLWDIAAAEPNLGVEIPISGHWSLGANAGLKAWPRYLAWDWDNENPTHWRNFAIVPEARFYFDQVYDGWFVGADIVYTHYNVGAVKFPFGVYSKVREHRLQGDLVGLGLFGGHSWWLGNHWRIEAEAGLAVGYNNAEKYECDHCGSKIGDEKGPVLVPKLGVNLAYNVRRKTREIIEILPPMPDTLVPPVPVPEPVAPILALSMVEEWKGVAGELAPHHPVLRPSSEYQPYTPDRILRKEEGALYVFFELDKSQLKRSFTEKDQTRDNSPVLDEIMHITASILADTTSSVSCIQIIGLASIEGSRSRNQALSDNRAKALQAYIQDRLAVPDSLFETVGGGEAWAEFRDQVNDLVFAGGGAGLTTEQLQKVLDIIDNDSDADRRERKLKALEKGAVYLQLKRYVLADQRNSGYIRVYFDHVPDTNALSINQAVDAIDACDPARALEILEGVKDDPRSRKAMASALLQLGRTDEAIAILQAAAMDGDASAKDYLRAREENQRQQAAYDAYLKELNEYNNYINNYINNQKQ